MLWLRRLGDSIPWSANSSMHKPGLVKAMLTLAITGALSCKLLLVSTSPLLLSSKPNFLGVVFGMHQSADQFPKLHSSYSSQHCRLQCIRIKVSLQNI